MTIPYNPLMKPPLGTPINKARAKQLGHIGYWPMNENGGATVQDLSGNGNTGVFVDNTAWVSGKFGPALAFDGTNDNVNFGDSDLFSFTDGAGNDKPFSISTWVKASTLSGSILNKYNATGDNREWQFYFYNNQQMRLGLYNYDSASNRIRAYCSVVGWSGDWFHAAVTYDGSELWTGIKAYLNGVQRTTFNDSLGTYVGMSNRGEPVLLSATLAGQIGSMAVYNRVLTASEIALLHREPFCMFKDPAEAALLGGYQVAGGVSVPVMYHHYQIAAGAA